MHDPGSSHSRGMQSRLDVLPIRRPDGRDLGWSFVAAAFDRFREPAAAAAGQGG